MDSFEILPLGRERWDEAAQLIYRSLNAWYRKNRGFDLVTGPSESMLLFPRVYEALDPGCCAAAFDRATGRLAGTCFYHPRPTHVALGILNVEPDYFGRGVAGRILRFVIDFAESEKKPVRLVSSAMNLDSFSLYNRHGFVPTVFFQDMTVTVPPGGFPVEPPEGFEVRDAHSDDIPAMVALERELYSVEREKDWRFFLANEGKIWGLSVLVEKRSGRIDGFTASVCDPGSNMIGPGIARTDEGAAALVRRELSRYPGKSPVWLVPGTAVRFRAAMYSLGATNCETHIAQVRGEAAPPSGVVLPSFMPETA